MVDVRDLELVTTVLREGNFARAARVLGLGAPVLSRRISDLEHRLGGSLFLRGHGAVDPTDLCRALVLDAEDILARMNALARRVSETRGHQTQEVRIAAGGFVCETCVLPAAAAMLRRRPDLRIGVVPMNWTEVATAVREREAELGALEVSDVENEAPDLVVEPLREHPAFFAARAGHPLARRPAVTLAEILGYPSVFANHIPKRLIAVFTAAREAARAAGAAHPAYPAVRFESPGMALRLAAASDAVVGVTGPIADQAIRAGDIAILPWHEPWAFLRFGLLQARGRRLPAAAGEFAEALREADALACQQGMAMLARIEAAKAGAG